MDEQKAKEEERQRERIGEEISGEEEEEEEEGSVFWESGEKDCEVIYWKRIE